MRKINEIIVHCTATPEGKNFKAADIDIKEGFADSIYTQGQGALATSSP